jgi:NADH-quinone oxidoreductase subunit N
MIDIAAILTCLLSFEKRKSLAAEYFAFLLAATLGAHLLVMTSHFAVVFISLELISISSYILAGYSFTKAGSEGSLKYFLFGAAAAAIMLYGFSFLYGITGTLDFSSHEFVATLLERSSVLTLAACLLALSGFLFKMAVAPMHLWAPDVYEAAPVPVVAFLSVVPKLAGLGVLVRFTLAISASGQPSYDWQSILGGVAMLTLVMGNFSALRQKNVKRMMAYSSIAQSGFLLVGVVSFLPQGLQFTLFYAGIYLVMNFLVFLYLRYFENNGIHTIAQFRGAGKAWLVPCIFMLIGLISLTGLPPTAGFTAKLFVFTGLWQAYELTGKPLLLWLLIVGLLNTVVSLFYYLRIPYFAFLKSGEPAKTQNITEVENLLGIILVLAVLVLFFFPALLMGWINKINFVF